MFPNGQSSVSSLSSTSTNGYAFNRIIKDFKKALGDRKTPKNLVFLNRIVILILFATIILSSIDYAILRNEITSLSSGNDQALQSELRMLKEVQLASNVRSYIHIANGLEFDHYDGA